MAIEKEIDIKVDSKDAEQGFAKLADAINDLNKTFSKFSEDTKDGLEDINNTSKKTEKGVGGIAKGFKGLGVAMKAAGIGLVIGALTTLKEVFTSNQKVADLFATAFETVSLVFNSFVETIVDVVEKVNEATGGFDALKKVVGGLLTIAITPLKLAFFGIKLGLQEAQLAWEQSFFGDKDPTTIKELNAAIKETRNDLADVAVAAVDAGKQVANNIVEAVGEVTTLVTESIDGVSKISVSAAYEAAKTNVQLQNSAKLAAAEQSLLVEKYDIQAEKLRQIRDEERNSIEERKQANDDLLKVLEEQEKAMLAQADAQVAAAQAEVNKNKSIENQVALTEALANKQGVLAQIEGFRSEQKSNDLALDREEIELTNSKLESENQLSIERQRFNAEQIEDEYLRLQRLQEIDLLEAEQEATRLQAIVDNANAGTQAKIDAQIALDEFLEQSRQQNLAREKEIAEQERQLEKQKIQDKQMVLDAIGQFADAETGIGKALLIAKQALALKETLMDLKRITFKGTQAVSEAGVNAAQNVSESSKIGFPQNIITIAAAIAQGISIIGSVKKAVSKTKAKASGAVASTPTAPTTPSTTSIPPAFNIVGASGTSQLAEAIGEQEQQPVQAYVVANDVTTAQSMDRNIVEGASIG
jgi:hypothetical protein